MLALIKNWTLSQSMRLDSRVKPDMDGASGDVKSGDCPAESRHSPKAWIAVQCIKVVVVFFYLLLNEWDITVLTLK